jgi:hypothetical protein
MTLRCQRTGAVWTACAALSLAPLAVFGLAERAPWTAPDDGQAELDALSKELDASREAVYEQYRKLAAEFDDAKATDAERVAFKERMSKWWEDNDPSPAFVERFEALAKKHKGAPVALEGWINVIELDSKKLEGDPDRPAKRAFAALLADHLQSEKLESVCANLQYGSVLPHAFVIEIATKIRQGSPHRKVQAAAALALAAELSGERADASDKVKARDVYLEVASRFADLAASNGRNYGRTAQGFVFELDHLQPQMLAPDFEAIDENGAKFKLSDYRGKVVMLDFWGFW